MDKYIEDNYRALVAEGAFTSADLRAMAAERTDPELLRLCDELDQFVPPTGDPVVETASIGPEETTSKPAPTVKE